MDLFHIMFEAKKEGDFKLSSGKTSNYYFDIKSATLNPKKCDYLASLISEKIVPTTDKIMGIELGSVMLATMVSHITGNPLLILRPEPQDHALRSTIVGDIKKGDKITIIDDVFTTGHSIQRADETIRYYSERGAEDIIVVVTRDRLRSQDWGIKHLWSFYESG